MNSVAKKVLANLPNPKPRKKKHSNKKLLNPREGRVTPKLSRGSFIAIKKSLVCVKTTEITHNKINKKLKNCGENCEKRCRDSSAD